jgi:hypothetical protein
MQAEAYRIDALQQAILATLNGTSSGAFGQPAAAPQPTSLFSTPAPAPVPELAAPHAAPLTRAFGGPAAAQAAAECGGAGGTKRRSADPAETHERARTPHASG